MGIRLPRRTVRFRLTALCSMLFLAAGAALLAITYGLVDGTTAIALFREGDGTAVAAGGQPAASSAGHIVRVGDGNPTATQLQMARQLYAQAVAQHDHDLHQLLIQSGIALAIMAVLAIGLGWLITGRMLRPLRVMKAATQRITERSLHERLSLPGPEDEVKDLADTIDGLLARLETAFEAQRRFVASASHELRTPLTLNRALLEVALADPDADAGELRTACEEVLAAGEHQERLVDGLLTLATSERGLDRREVFDLADATRQALAPHRAEAERRGLAVTTDFHHVTVLGDPDLAERMAANLIDNAIRYNVPGGHVDVTIEVRHCHAVLTVTNTGPVIPAGQAGQLLQPFQRLPTGQAGHLDGHGLGLSIVHAIATAHAAHLDVRIRLGGGLIVTVRFPPAGITRPFSGDQRPFGVIVPGLTTDKFFCLDSNNDR